MLDFCLFIAGYDVFVHFLFKKYPFFDPNHGVVFGRKNMKIPKLSIKDEKRIKNKVENLLDNAFFNKDIQKLRKKWKIKHGSYENSGEFYGILIADSMKSPKVDYVNKFHRDVIGILEKYQLPMRYMDLIWAYSLGKKVYDKSIKKNMDKLSPIRIEALDVDREGEQVVSVKVHGDATKEDFISSWDTVDKYIKIMNLKGQELKKYDNYIRDRYFHETRTSRPDISDLDLALEYEDITGEEINTEAVRMARKRYRKWEKTHKRPYPGCAKDKYLYDLKKCKPNIKNRDMVKSYSEQFGERIYVSEVKEAIERYQSWRERNSKS